MEPETACYKNSLEVTCWTEKRWATIQGNQFWKAVRWDIADQVCGQKTENIQLMFGKAIYIMVFKFLLLGA